MRSMRTRRVAQFAGAATVAAVALAGCSTGQVAETANKNPSVYGVNAENANNSVAVRGLAVTYGTPKGYPSGANAPLEVSLFNRTSEPVTVTITSQPLAGAEAKSGVLSARAVGIVGGAPTPAGSTVPGDVEPTGSRPAARPQVTVSQEAGQPTGPNASATASVEPGASAEPSASAQAGASAEPSGTAQPGAAASTPAQIQLAPLDSFIYSPDDTQKVQLIGLSGPLVPGNSVNLIFTFSNGAAPLVLQAPVAVPQSPAPRGSAENEGVGEGEHEGQGH